MIIEILLGIIALILTIMGIGMVKLQKTVSSRYNLANVQQSSSRIRKAFSDLGKKLHQYSPNDLVGIFNHYNQVGKELDRKVEEHYRKPFVQTIQDVEIIKQYTQAGLSILYKYMGKVPTEVLLSKLERIIGAISVLGEEFGSYERLYGTGKVGKEKYKLKI